MAMKKILHFHLNLYKSPSIKEGYNLRLLVGSNPVPSILRNQFLSMMVVMVMGLSFTTGCASVSSPSRLQAYLAPDIDPTIRISNKFPPAPPDGLPIRLALVADFGDNSSIVPSEAFWGRLTTRLGFEVEKNLPVKVQDIVRLNGLTPGKGFEKLPFEKNKEKSEFFLLVLVSSTDVTTTAYYTVLPDTGSQPGSEIENHAEIELGLVDADGKQLLAQVRGGSYATLEQLDVPLLSNRYPAVKGSSMTNPIYPQEETALEILRMVSTEEALDQAIMKMEIEWRKAREPSVSR